MLKTISNLGLELTKNQQKSINGGGCPAGLCREDGRCGPCECEGPC